MPRQLDYCSACRAPIFLEHVAGACTCELGKLRAIQAHLKIQQQDRLGQIRKGVGAFAPPDLAAAVRAAADARQASLQQGHAPRVLDLESILMGDARRSLGMSEFNGVFSEARQVEARSVETRSDPVSPRQQAMVRNRFALESLWDTSEVPPGAVPVDEDAWVANMEAEFPPGGPLETDFTSEIQFDTGDIDFNDDNAPRMQSSREAVRFRADRGLPPREPFLGSVVEGSDGRTVGNVRSFREVRELARQAAPVVRDSGRRVGPVTTRQATADEVRRVRADAGRSVQAATEASNQRQRPTVYDRLRGRDPFDDE